MAFSYRIAGVGDFDQRWNLLPARGKNHCVPTSWVNWMHYFAINGRLTALPFANGGANQIANNIAAMADYMDTDPDDGTSSSDAIDGLLDWSDDRNLPYLVISARATDNDNIRYTGLRNLLKMGAHVVVGRGRYRLEDGEFERTGGHAMSVVSLDRTADGTITIGVHNPWNDSDRSTQDPAHVQRQVLTEKRRNIEGDTVTVLRWGPNSVNPPYHCIDGWTAVLPLFAVTQIAADALTTYRTDIGDGRVSRSDVALPFAGGISDLALDPSAPFASVLSSARGEVWTLDLAEGSWRRRAAAGGARAIAYGGRRQRLLVASGQHLSAFDDDDNRVGIRDLGGAIESLSYDAAADRFVALASDRIHAIEPGSLRVAASVDAPPLAGAGARSLSVNRRDGGIAVFRDNSAEVATLRWAGNGTLATRWARLPIEGAPAGAHVDHRGRITLAEGGRIATFDANGRRLSGGTFDGQPAGRLLKIARSSHALDRERSQRKAWRN